MSADRRFYWQMTDDEFQALARTYREALAAHERQFEAWYFGPDDNGPSLAELAAPWVPPDPKDAGPSFKLLRRKEEP